MTTHLHSRAAYSLLQPSLNVKQQEVLLMYSIWNELTDEQAAEKLGWPINRVSGRVGELVKMGKLEPYTDRIQNGRKVRVCRIIR